MRTLARCAAIGALVVALLGAVFALIVSRPAETQSEGVVFASAEPVDVRSVTVRNSSGAYSFYFEDDGYVLDDIPPEIADLDAFIGFMTNCARLSAVQRIPLKDAELSDYGLSEPQASAEIDFFDGSILKLAIGGVERVSRNYYASVEGFDGVYVMSGTLAEQFLLPKTQIISRYVTPPLAVSSPLSAVRDITFTGGSLAEPVTILATADGSRDVALAAMSFGTATHIVRGAGVYQLDQTYGIEVIGSLFGITATDIAGYNLSAEEIASYGFHKPYMTVEYDMVNGVDAEERHIRLMLAEKDESGFYAMLEGGKAVYVIGREPFTDLRYDKLLLRWFLTPLLMDLSAVTVESAEGRYRFNIDNTDPRDPVVSYDGQVLDTGLFRSFFRLITSAAHDGTYLGPIKPPEGGKLLSITYEYTDPDKSPDTLALYPGESRRANVFVNGVGEFAMKDLFADRVREGCASLIAGDPIEENW